MSAIKEYYLLIKPGIVRSNLLAAITGFLFASQGSFDWQIFLAVAVGTTAIVASGCVANNYMDRHIDSQMNRTKNRAVVTGRISGKAALVYSAILFIIGFTSLVLLTNILAVIVGVMGFIGYVFVYGYAKRTTIHSTLIGSLPGATPILAGYVAVTGTIDVAAMLLFLSMIFWQMPHFFAIGAYRKKDYTAADLPILPVQKDIIYTKRQVAIYIVLYFTTVVTLVAVGHASITFLIVMGILCLRWIIAAQKSFSDTTTKWARQIFLQSLIILLIYCVLLSLNHWLP